MAARTYPVPTEIGKVLIPTSLLDGIDDFLEFVNRRIMEDAVRRAFARKTGPKAGIVTVADLVQSTRNIAPSIETDLEGILKSCEVGHARKKAS